MGRILPILFNTDMVQAILENRKTVTRRICKDADDHTVPDMDFYDAKKRTYAVHSYADKEHKQKLSIAERRCPICPGDILYARETWAQVKDIDDWEKFYRSNSHPITPDEYIYKADNVCVNGILPEIKWHPSIHMPKGAARIWLKVQNVRVERLQDMAFEDCFEEGIRFYDCPAGFTWKSDTDMKNCYIDAIGAMRALWNLTISAIDLDQYGWEANSWVWVIEFERCEKPEGTI